MDTYCPKALNCYIDPPIELKSSFLHGALVVIRRTQSGATCRSRLNSIPTFFFCFCQLNYFAPLWVVVDACIFDLSCFFWASAFYLCFYLIKERGINELCFHATGRSK